MNTKNCIFCKIAKGELPCVKIWEDEKHMAFLDIQPNTEGQTLVIPKEHYDSDFIEMPDGKYQKLMIAAKRVAKLLKQKLEVEKVALIVEGLGVNHVHAKLYPLYESHEGYITTQLGPEKSTEELNKVAEKIRK